MIKAYAAHEKGKELKPFEYDPGELGEETVEINVEYCGICHSDLSMLDNEWEMSEYPLVPGHEVVGTVQCSRKGSKNRFCGAKSGVRLVFWFLYEF